MLDELFCIFTGTKTHTHFSNGTKFCTENQNRCCLPTPLFVYTLGGGVQKNLKRFWAILGEKSFEYEVIASFSSYYDRHRTHFCNSFHLSVGWLVGLCLPGKMSGYVHVIPDQVVFILNSKIIFLRCHLCFSFRLCCACLGSVRYFLWVKHCWLLSSFRFLSSEPLSRHMPHWKDFIYFIHQKPFQNGVRAVLCSPFLFCLNILCIVPCFDRILYAHTFLFVYIK